MNAQVNIILPVLNRPEHTEQCIRSLYDNTPRDLFTLLVIDDGSEKATYSLLKSLSREFGFQILHHAKSFGPGYSRNEGAKYLTTIEARKKYLYHCDNDVYYRIGWLDQLIKIYEVVSKARVALLGASCHPFLQNNATISAGVGLFTVGIKDAVSGYSQLMTWEIWDRFGEFTTQEGLDKKTGRSDDWEYCQRIIKAGLLVGSVEPELVIPCGKTDSYGDPAVGQETFKNHEGIIIK